MPAGTATLVRFILRRDRVRLAVWVVGIVVLSLTSASSVQSLYPTAADLAAAAELVSDNAAVVAMNGPTIGLDTIGGRTVFEIGAFGYIVMALMNIFLVGRHTRAEEETGRAELVRAAAVGRHATLTATLAVALAADVLVGGLIAGGLIGQDLPVAGSLAFAAALALVGFVFATVTGVTAQITEFSRPAYGLAAAVLGVSFVVRAVGDVGSGTLSWFSPIGWGQAVRPYSGERWWVLALPILASLALGAVAFLLADRRDLGAGLVATRPGPPAAGPTLTRPVGLAWRLQRGSIIAWTIGLFLGGVAYGSVGKDIEDFVGDNETINDIIAQAGGSLVDSFLATTMMVLALIASGFAIQSAMRVRAEETAGRGEALLATALSRPKWLASHLTMAFVGSVITVGAAGLGAGLAYGISIGEAGEIPRLVGASLALVPAVWVVAGLTTLLIGLVPRAVLAAWGVLAFCLVVGFFGQLLSLPEWVRNLSPFEHVPSLPAADFDVVPLVALTVVAAALVLAGAVAFRRRDLTTV
jgi:ABC-2 type transport system permease protein